MPIRPWPPPPRAAPFRSSRSRRSSPEPQIARTSRLVGCGDGRRGDAGRAAPPGSRRFCSPCGRGLRPPRRAARKPASPRGARELPAPCSLVSTGCPVQSPARLFSWPMRPISQRCEEKRGSSGSWVRSLPPWGMVDRSPLPCDANYLNAQKNGSARCGSESGRGRPRCGASSASTHTRS